MENKYDYYLWQLNTYRKRTDNIRFFHFNSLPNYGFRSVYGVTEETAKAITESGTTAAFKGPVWSERLWLDIDDYEKAEAVKERFKVNDYDFAVYDSGRRGLHIGVMRTAEPSHLLPLQDAAWAKEHVPETDFMLYTQHLHLLRQPGSRHEKTGRYKTLTYSQPGRAITVASPSFESTKKVGLVSHATTSVFEDRLIQTLTAPQENGQRHRTLVTLAYALKKRGEPLEIIHWYLLQTNLLFAERKSEEEVKKIAESIYKS